MTESDNSLIQPWLPDQINRLGELAVLEPDWDSYLADPPSLKAVETTESLLHTLSALATVKPEYSPTLIPGNDGSIQIEYHEQGYDLEIVVEANGKITGWLNDAADASEVDW